MADQSDFIPLGFTNAFSDDDDELSFEQPIFANTEFSSLQSITNAFSNGKGGKHSNKSERVLPNVAWRDWDEFETVYNDLYGLFNVCYPATVSTNECIVDSIVDIDIQSLNRRLKSALDTIEMWRCRQRIPVCIDVSSEIINALYQYSYQRTFGSKLKSKESNAISNISNSNQELLKRTLAMNICRLVNRLTDPLSNYRTAQRSTADWSRLLSFPVSLISLRHDIVHERLPSFHTIYQHSILALQWLNNHYWTVMINKRTDFIDTLKCKTDNYVTMAAVAESNASESNNDDKSSGGTTTDDQSRIENKAEALKELMQWLNQNCKNELMATRYVIPLWIESYFVAAPDYYCAQLLQSLSKARRNKRLTIDVSNAKHASKVFQSRFVTFQPCLQWLIKRYPYIVMTLVRCAMQYRVSIYESHRSNSLNPSENWEIALISCWLSHWLTERQLWQHFTASEMHSFLKSIILSATQYCIDDWSQKLLTSITAQCKYYKFKDLLTVTKTRQYCQPLMRSQKSDATFDSLTESLKSEQTKLQKLVDWSKTTQHKSDNVESNCDSQWQRSNESQFVPIGSFIGDESSMNHCKLQFYDC